MALLYQPMQVSAQLPKFFETIRAGTAPPTFNRQFLKDIGFKSSNHHAFIPLLKGLGFLSENGTPTERYKAFLDESKWRKVLAQAVREAYDDIFVIKAKPGKADIKAISGKFKSTFNVSETSAERSARTFLALLELADEETLYASESTPEVNLPVVDDDPPTPPQSSGSVAQSPSQGFANPGLHYNIQIHLPATKDIETYNAIFKSLRSHLLD
jgi:hypothetical protein